MWMLISNIARITLRIGECIEFLFVFPSIVGDDDGGKVFTPEEYEQYKKQVLPMVRRTKLFFGFTYR